VAHFALSIEGFAKVAPYLTNPLVLIGFGLFLSSGICKVLVRSGILPPVSRSASSAIVRLLLRYGFILALSLIISGVGLAAWQSYLKAGAARPAKIAGNATASGDGSVANTGDGNTIKQSSPQKQRPSK